ncbi:hypothetical protein BSL78_18354 [Apostichopus japonicus]|uniref:Uncharacterized protein n=1 Tax=Stichopus japonicus TaxID=307972 RepID=A0A2G8K9Y4_STIJA|nr:hypothetical protein BSL78_18354 [Apostichopus japonicus]
MVRELSAMRLMLRKLSTLLHEEKVVKTRSSEVQCDPMWNRCHKDSQTEISELMNSSSVSVASVQCNIHPEKLTCGSQYEKPRELVKPSRLATPTSKLTKPRTSQPSSKRPIIALRNMQIEEPGTTNLGE